MSKSQSNPDLVDEVKSLKAHGLTQIRLGEFERRLRAIGYRFNRDMDCRSTSRYMTGPRAGCSTPSLSLSVVQIDNSMGCFHVDARRDTNYQALMVLRDSVFCVSRGDVGQF
jgi:hypothetical protein